MEDFAATYRIDGTDPADLAYCQQQQDRRAWPARGGWM